jgi:hypothetical protein
MLLTALRTVLLALREVARALRSIAGIEIDRSRGQKATPLEASHVTSWYRIGNEEASISKRVMSRVGTGLEMKKHPLFRRIVPRD